MNLSKRNKVSTQANMSSMTDLVFLMLIFFIILSTLVTEGLAVDPPTANTGESTVGNTVVVTITKDTVYQVNDRSVPKSMVEELVKNEISQLSPGEEPSIIVRVDKSVPTGETVFVMDIAKKNKCKFVLATRKE